MKRVQNHRPGFTLIELLVVMGLIILLAAITVTVSYSGLIDNYRTIGAGDRVSKWLVIAKVKAQRDQLPCGVRFFADGNGMIKEAQYIEVPDPFVPLSSDPTKPPTITITKAPAGNSVTLANVTNLTNNVQAEDTLVLPEFNLLLKIASVTATSITLTTPSLLPDLGGATSYSTTAFGFLRAARPMAGEEVLLLTGQTAIDGNISSPAISPGTSFDVLFTPNGEVLNASKGSVILWVRDPGLATSAEAAAAATYDKAGQMGLITVYTKTGSVATHPVTRGADPYAATKDGINTGL